MKIKYILLTLLLSISFSFAMKIKVAAGLSVAPYIIRDNDSGIEMDIVRESLKLSGHEIGSIIYASNKRVENLISNGIVHMGLNIPPNLKNVYYSDVIINFHNVAISLKKNNLEIKNINDLYGKRVLAFQNASKFFGEEYKKFTRTSKKYKETVNQVSQVEQLYKNRTDVIISDIYVFLYYSDLLKNFYDNTAKLVYSEILPSSPRFAAFTDKKLRDEFNLGLRKFKNSNAHKDLIKKYNP